jgi:hypothetical protein
MLLSGSKSGFKDRSMADRSFEAIVATTVLGVKIFQSE